MTTLAEVAIMEPVSEIQTGEIQQNPICDICAKKNADVTVAIKFQSHLPLKIVDICSTCFLLIHNQRPDVTMT